VIKEERILDCFCLQGVAQQTGPANGPALKREAIQQKETGWRKRPVGHLASSQESKREARGEGKESLDGVCELLHAGPRHRRAGSSAGGGCRDARACPPRSHAFRSFFSRREATSPGLWVLTRPLAAPGGRNADDDYNSPSKVEHDGCLCGLAEYAFTRSRRPRYNYMTPLKDSRNAL